MKTITVERHISAPPEQVFEVLTDHENYQTFQGVQASKLERAGEPERNGLGAIRHIRLGGGWLREEITAYDAPKRFDYLIIETSLPLQHQGGSVCLETTAEGTLVTWTSTIRITVPVIGGWLTGLAVGQLGRGFASMLKEVDRRLAVA